MKKRWGAWIWTALDILIVENIGNLVCPAEFDIGEDKRAVILSVTEGEDKPLKYPLMFRECDAALLNKIDLLPHLDYDIKLAAANILQIHPDMPVFETSAKTEEGFERLGWNGSRPAVRGKIRLVSYSDTPCVHHARNEIKRPPKAICFPAAFRLNNSIATVRLSILFPVKALAFW